MEHEDATILLTDEQGKEIEFDHLLTFEYEGNRYVALMPVDAVEGIADDEVLILRIFQKDGEDILVSVDNEILLEEVFNEFLAIMDEEEEDDSE